VRFQFRVFWKLWLEPALVVTLCLLAPAAVVIAVLWSDYGSP